MCLVVRLSGVYLAANGDQPARGARCGHLLTVRGKPTMYSVIEIGMILRSVAQFNSYAEAAEYVSRLSNPDGFIISEVV